MLITSEQTNRPPYHPGLILLYNHLHSLLAAHCGLGLPTSLDLDEVDFVLDVICGTGNWAQDMAFVHPDIKVYGLDSDPSRIVCAQAQLRVQHLDNLLFLEGTPASVPALLDGMFDLLHLCCVAPRVPTEVWPLLLQDLLRLSRPGGYLCWTEAQAPVSTSPALQRLYQWGAHLCAAAGFTLDITASMDTLLREAGWQPLQRTCQCIDLAAGTRRFPPIMPLARDATRVLAAVLHAQGAEDMAEWEALQEQVLCELYAPTFGGSCTLLSLLSRKAGPACDTREEKGNDCSHPGD